MDKVRSYEFAQSQGARIPDALVSGDRARDEAFLKEYGRLVVKPSAQGGSKGVTRDVTTKTELDAARTSATYGSKPAIVQEQFDAEEIRVTVIKGRAVSVLSRESPAVIGDGAATLADLIARENAVRRTLVTPLFTYPELTADLIDPALLTSATVPARGERVRLGRVSAAYLGATYHGVTDTIHPSFKRLAERLAGALNPAFLAVDFLVKDFSLPAEDDNYRFLEFTTSPSVYLYPSVRDGDDQTHVITKIADLIDEYAACAR